MEKMKKWFQNNKCIFMTTGVMLFIVAVNLYLFRGNVNYGMEFDEVYRLNNLFPIIYGDVYPYNQSICSLNIWGISIPLMYKEYISSMSLLPGLFVVLLGNSLLSLRYSYILFTIGLEIIVFFFLNQHNRFVAVLSACFLAVCPIIFPYIRFGWATLTYGYFIVLGLYFIRRYRKNKKRINLFLGVYSFSLLVNVYFYSLWIIGGTLFAVIVLYPKKTLMFFKNWRNVLISFCSIVLGLFNYIYYNIVTGFPSLMTLINYLFHLEKYNQTAIDGKKTESLLSSFGGKINSYLTCIGPMYQVYLFLLLGILLIYLAFLFVSIKRRKFQEKKNYFAPLIATIVSFALMLISPNSQGSHHITYIVIYLSVVIGIGLWLLFAEFGIKKEFVSLLAIPILSFNFYQCNVSVNKNIISNGNGYFTEKIFDLVDYIHDEPSIDETNTAFIEWGFSSQFYFLNEGKFNIQDITFSIMNRTNEQRAQYLQTFFTRITSKELYIPVYYSDMKGMEYAYREIAEEDISAFTEPVQAFIIFVRENGGSITVQEWFPDDDGWDTVLLKIYNIKEIKKSIASFKRTDLENVKASSFYMQDDYEYLRGFYGYSATNSLRWTKKESRVLLNYDNQQYFRMQFWVPAIEQRDQETIVEVKINGKTVYSEKIEDAKRHTIQMETSEIFDDRITGAADIEISVSSQVINTPDVRELGCCIEYIEFTDLE